MEREITVADILTDLASYYGREARQPLDVDARQFAVVIGRSENTARDIIKKNPPPGFKGLQVWDSQANSSVWVLRRA